MRPQELKRLTRQLQADAIGQRQQGDRRSANDTYLILAMGTNFLKNHLSASRRRKTLKIGKQILFDVALISHQLLRVQRLGDVKALTGLARQEWFGLRRGLRYCNKLQISA
ncbi:hypothetical protein IVG45_07160 [Methylomonas sp. LL1]|uniref:hypothetical protein n=1 Tax=Methylomonas sp. LL1 TaxID=2785785 RepID=UPI0018C40EDF|nr:hypothetical protein [Methylomonas sp. LL1]QPK64721.1 hypothetical protein IVG45_07160 [Methylomonas sp. LL1]